jgi:hypothetical protein
VAKHPEGRKTSLSHAAHLDISPPPVMYQSEDRTLSPFVGQTIISRDFQVRNGISQIFRPPNTPTLTDHPESEIKPPFPCNTTATLFLKLPGWSVSRDSIRCSCGGGGNHQGPPNGVSAPTGSVSGGRGELLRQYVLTRTLLLVSSRDFPSIHS